MSGRTLTLDYIVLLVNSAQCPMTLIRHGVTIEALENEHKGMHGEDIIQTRTEKKRIARRRCMKVEVEAGEFHMFRGPGGLSITRERKQGSWGPGGLDITALKPPTSRIPCHDTGYCILHTVLETVLETGFLSFGAPPSSAI